MEDTPVMVDPDGLRAAAARVERSADALSRFRLPEPDSDALRGSAVSATAGPAVLASAIESLIAEMAAWADAARASAAAFERAEQANAARLTPS